MRVWPNKTKITVRDRKEVGKSDALNYDLD